MLFGLLALGGLIAASALFVLAEFALVTIDRTRVDQLAEEGDKGARRVRSSLQRLSFELSGAQLGITLTSIVVGFVAEPILVEALNGIPRVDLEPGSGGSVAIALSLSTIATMVFGELVPKTYAIARPWRTARVIVLPMRGFSAFFGPLIRLLNGAANAIVRLLGVEPREELEAVRSLEEMEILIRGSVEHGAVDAATLPLLKRTIAFGEKDAREALVPRVALVAMVVTDTVAELARVAHESGHSRILVYSEGGDLDDAIGVVHVKNAYRVPRTEWETTTIARLVDDVPFVPESRSLESILKELAGTGRPLAVVVDEYGGTAGIITVEDILEEIVGEIEDEYDPAVPEPPTPAVAGTSEVSGMAHADELREQTGFDLPEGEYETLGGFVQDRLGRIPVLGDLVDENGWEFEVAAMDGRRVDRVRVRHPVGFEPPRPGPGIQTGDAR